MTRHESQRGYFAYALHEAMAKDPRIHLLTGDLGYGMFDSIKQDFPDRFLNCGASEQAMIGIAVGLSQEGKIPFVYTITSFLLRGAETIGLYLNHEQANVKLVGGGRDNDYKDDGISHDGTLAQNFIKGLKVHQFYPEIKEDVPEMFESILETNGPCFLSLRR